MPLSIPGLPIRPADRPTKKKCPHCNRPLQGVSIVKKGGQTVMKCPSCHKVLSTVKKSREGK